MAIIQALCNCFHLDVLRGMHQPEHDYKIALYTDIATLGEDTEVYTSANEVEGTNYEMGGKSLSGVSYSREGRVSYMTFDDPQWPNSTIRARGGLIYNNSLPGKNAIAVLDFGKNYRSTNGLFEVLLPPPTATKALIRLGAR